MLNKKKYLNKKIKYTDFISYDRALLFSNIYLDNQVCLRRSFLPRGWHWIYFPENNNTMNLGKDGHSKRGLFLPKLEGYKRMFAGSSIRFYGDFKYNTEVKKCSYVEAINSHYKKNTTLYFIDIKHTYTFNKKCLLEENQKLAFIKNDYVSKRKRTFNFKNIILLKKIKYNFNSIILFRYSALTYNSHRIHYDLDYVKKYEGYKNLLVHGPLLANLTLDNIKNKLKINLKEFSFKIYKPIFVNEDFYIKIYKEEKNNKKIRAFIINNSGTVSLTAEGIYS